jgi:hypothetical protein
VTSALQFSLVRTTRLLIVALEALFIAGMVAGAVSTELFIVMGRPEARVYATLSLAGLLSLVLVVAVDAIALFSPSLRRFALFGLGRLLIYFIVMIGFTLFTPLP